jgi:hypothetical protein
MTIWAAPPLQAKPSHKCQPRSTRRFSEYMSAIYVGHTCRSHPSSVVRVYDLNMNIIVGWIVEPIVIREARLRSREVQGSGLYTSGTKKWIVPKSHWYEEIVSTKVGLVLKYC